MCRSILLALHVLQNLNARLVSTFEPLGKLKTRARVIMFACAPVVNGDITYQAPRWLRRLRVRLASFLAALELKFGV
jgi:hypothetical protein